MTELSGRHTEGRQTVSNCKNSTAPTGSCLRSRVREVIARPARVEAARQEVLPALSFQNVETPWSHERCEVCAVLSARFIRNESVGFSDVDSFLRNHRGTGLNIFSVGETALRAFATEVCSVCDPKQCCSGTCRLSHLIARSMQARFVFLLRAIQAHVPAVFVDKTTKVICQGLTGKNGTFHTEQVSGTGI